MQKNKKILVVGVIRNGEKTLQLEISNLKNALKLINKLVVLAGIIKSC